MTASAHRVFLTQTVYHFILAAGLAAREQRLSGARSTLLFVRDFDGAEAFLDAARRWPSSPFAAIHDLGRYDRNTSRRARRRSSGELARRMAGVLQDPPHSVYVFNDRHEFAQELLEGAAAAGAECVYVEDGTAAYSDRRFKPRNLLQRIERRWQYGRRWSDLLALGTHPRITRRILNFPEHARAELKALGGLERYPLADLQSIGLGEMAQQLAVERGLDVPMLQRSAVIFAVSASNILRRVPDYRERAQGVLRGLREAGLGVAYKFHPREQQADFIGAAGVAPECEIPRGLPIEFVSLVSGPSPRVLLADFSTSLLVSPYLNRSVRAAAFMPQALDDLGLRALYAGLEIPLLPDPAAIAAFCRGIGAA